MPTTRCRGKPRIHRDGTWVRGDDGLPCEFDRCEELVSGSATRCEPCLSAYRRCMPLTKCKGFGSLEGRCAEIGVFPRRGTHAYLCPGCIEYRQGRAEQTTLQTSTLRLCRTCGNGARLSSYASQSRPGLFYHDCLACRNKAANANLEDKHRGIAQRWAGENSNKQERPDDIDQAFGRMGLGDDSRRESAINERRKAESRQLDRGWVYTAGRLDRRLKEKLVEMPCFYCGDLGPEGRITANRMGTLLDGTLEVYASCCERCAFSKAALDAFTFVRRCRHIDAFQAHGRKPHHRDAWPDVNKSRDFAALVRDAGRDERKVLITKEEHDEIVARPCVYCGFDKGLMGIDMINNFLDYVPGKMVPCCAHCNRMKRNITKKDFFHMCRKVARIADLEDLPAMRINLFSNKSLQK